MHMHYTIEVRQKHTVIVDSPDDHYEEFVREVSAELLRADIDLKDPGREAVGCAHALYIRGGAAMDLRVSILDTADAHSQDAHDVTSAVFGRYETRIENLAGQCVHNILYVTDMTFNVDGWKNSDLDLWFLERFWQQFEADLIVVDAGFRRSERLKFKKMPGSSRKFLMRSTAFKWETGREGLCSLPRELDETSTPTLPKADNDVVVH